mmetsp:Transcript_87303/g.242143  ORF Transcript_87303/g.242143 Transcript_87303/m.242143 type:complete len:399 (+) Transcript_87303:89-1285(+)
MPPHLPLPPDGMPTQEAKRRRLGSQSSTASMSSTTASSAASGPYSSPPSPSVMSDSRHSDPEVVEWWVLDALDANSPRRRALEELRRYFLDWFATPQDGFWHRKSGKPVLSVVVCRRKEGTLAVYRGMNTEVSLPAGSLCAERAAIARAASDFQQAEEVVAIATVDPTEKLNPLWPCEVCQSWLAKLRPMSPEISVLAVASTECKSFLVKVNGELQPPPQPVLPPSPLLGALAPWPELVELAEGTAEWPWEAKDLVYVDGAWTFLHGAQQNILKQARMRGTHLLVGVHSDEVLKKEFSGPILESYSIRAGRILQNRHVSSVLKDAPWSLTLDMINNLGIQRVITGSVCKTQDVGKADHGGADDPYRVARDLGILEVVPSLDETTERSVHESHVARARN